MSTTDTKISEEEFSNRVDNRFKDDLIPLGKDKNGEQLFLEYDFSSVAFDPRIEEWVVAAIWFNVVDKTNGLRFTVWKQPEILLYENDRFAPKMEKWMTKKYGLVVFDNNAVSGKIKKIAENIKGD